MGVWNASISASDDFQDVKYAFFDYFYHDKISVEEIENKIIDAYRESITDFDSGEWHDVNFAIAYCEWKCGCLSDKIFKTCEGIISSGRNLEYWAELQATPEIIKKRKRELQKFLEKLKSENTKPIKRRYKKPFVFLLKTGDVFACYSKANGCYGCGIALEVRESQLRPWEEAYHFRALFAISEYTPKELPKVEQVVNSTVRDVFWNGDCVYNLPERGIMVLGNVADKIDNDYSEYFGSHKVNGRIYGVYHLRPNFDELISHDETKRIVDKFSISGKPMSFFFNKANLPTTNEVLGSDET